MRIVIVSTTKNEEDIIKSFVHHNGCLLDAFFFLDASTDSTRKILGVPQRSYSGWLRNPDQLRRPHQR